MLNIKSKIISVLMATLSASLIAIPVKAAEELFLSYDSVLLSVKVASLEAFAKEGKINTDLQLYLSRANAAEKEEFRQILLKRIDINPVLLSRFFNSAMGADILYRLGKGITLQGGTNGKYALRGAIVSAAFDPDGLTLLNVLKKLPVNIEFQGEMVIGLAKEAKEVVRATEFLVTEMRSLELQETNADPKVNYSTLPDLRKQGPYKVSKQVWHLTDQSRNRQFYVDVYIPQQESKKRIPVIVFSHGLSSRPEDYTVGLEHLASYGYMVAAPQHIGSDTIYLQEMLQGYHRNIFDLDEFINRPKDISYVIDELERRNQNEFQGRLDLKNIGAAGHSFGGYTVLGISGAQIDFENLQRDCDRLYAAIDISLLLECRALELPRMAYNFRDERVKAVYASNPVNRSIFGQKGISQISIPTVLGSGSYDPAAPPFFEQAASFTWLTTPDKYWAMVEGQAHVDFTNLDPGITKAINSVSHLTLPSQTLIGDYDNALKLAFFETYIQKNEAYRPYLQSSYSEYLSQDETFKLDFISGTSSNQLEEAIKKFK
ncbi:dienelactone hydrolase [Aphanothece hegewaldii CCALA 016]|uniref:Dienelactone hydrolase n=2 Tax=Aphanothece TaxID=1121 RepID=A0A2T1LSG9_9CHRO|nr:alpha/beta hydrolase [Aphanothece hegewaldii]PSF32460.1 dienelactone hydrolase [Aphanothece hegewaldii CCALA 016]